MNKKDSLNEEKMSSFGLFLLQLESSWNSRWNDMRLKGSQKNLKKNLTNLFVDFKLALKIMIKTKNMKKGGRYGS